MAAAPNVASASIVSFRSKLGPLRSGPFARPFAATLISAVGDWASLVALGFGVLAFASPTQLGLVLLARQVPVVALILIGGVYADRLSRRRVLYASNLLRGAAQAATAIMLTAGHPSIGLIAAAAALNGAGMAFARPAQTGFVSSLVAPPDLQPANALMSLSRNSVAIVGAALGAVLVDVASPAGALAADAASFIVAAALIARIAEGGTRAPRESTPLADIAAGWREFRSRTWVWVMVASFGVFQLMFFPITGVLGPLIAKQRLDGATSWAEILASGAMGAIVGDLVSLRVRPRRPLLASTLWTVPMAAYVASLGAIGSVSVISACAFVAWAGVGVSDTLWTTTLQRAVPDDILSRISSFDYLGSLALNPVGYALVGPIARTASAPEITISAGLVLALTTVVVVLVPSVRRLRADQGSHLPSRGTA